MRFLSLHPIKCDAPNGLSSPFLRAHSVRRRGSIAASPTIRLLHLCSMTLAVHSVISSQFQCTQTMDNKVGLELAITVDGRAISILMAKWELEGRGVSSSCGNRGDLHLTCTLRLIFTCLFNPSISYLNHPKSSMLMSSRNELTTCTLRTSRLITHLLSYGVPDLPICRYVQVAKYPDKSWWIFYVLHLANKQAGRQPITWFR